MHYENGAKIAVDAQYANYIGKSSSAGSQARPPVLKDFHDRLAAFEERLVGINIRLGQVADETFGTRPEIENILKDRLVDSSDPNMLQRFASLDSVINQLGRTVDRF